MGDLPFLSFMGYYTFNDLKKVRVKKKENRGKA